MSLNSEKLYNTFPEPYGLGPGTIVISYLNPRELRLNRDLNEKYYEYCDEYIRKYIYLMEELSFGLLHRKPPENQEGEEMWNLYISYNKFFKTIIKNNNTTKSAFYEKYVKIFKEMFKLNNIDEFKLSNLNNLISRCNPEQVSMYEDQYSNELEYLINIVEQVNQLSTDSLSW